MAYDLGRLNRYKFFHDGGRLDLNFIENVLLPGLSVQSKFAGGSSGVELPHGVNDPVEFIPLRDAAEIALDWFEQHQNLESDEARNIQSLIGKASYRQLSDTLELILHKRVQDPQKLLKSRLVQNVAELQHVKDLSAIESKSKSTYHPATNLITFAKLQAEITRLANLGISPAYINRLIPKSLTGVDGSLTQQRFINLIVRNPQLLGVVSLHPENHDLATVALADAFRRVVSDQDPDFAGINNFAGTDEFREGLYDLTTHLSGQLAQNNISISDYEDLQIKASYDLPHLLPAQAQLLDQISHLNTFSSQADKDKFARAIIGTIASSSGNLLTADQIVDLAGKQLGLPSSQISTLRTTLQSAGVLSAIEYQQNELHFDVTSRSLTSSERSLLQKGINPFHAHFEMSDLLGEASQILAISKISEADAEFKMRQLYEKELNSSSPSPVELSRLRGWLDRHHTLSYLDLPENSHLKRLAGRSRTERWLTDVSDRFKATETGFYNKLFKFQENLPWNVASRKFFEWYDKLAEKAVLKLPLPKGKKLYIPVFKVFPWIYDQLDKFKRITTLKTYASLSTPWRFANPIRNGLRFTLKQYSLGGYTVDGAVFRYGHKLWGKTLTWAVAKAGLPSLVKYPTTFAARILIKIGGKALAKFGLKAITALAAAGTMIGSILSVAMIIGLVFDVLKLGYDLIKKFIQDVDFRGFVLKIGASIAAAVLFIRNIPIFAFLLGVGALFVQGFLVAFGWAFGLLAVGLILWSAVNTTIRLDSGISSLVASVICDQSTLSNPSATANVALCIAELADECPGVNPMTESVVKSQSWQCFVGGLAFKEAITQLEYSSHVKNSASASEGNVQCVGLSAASAASGDGAFHRQTNACLYATDVPPGYKYLPGCPGMRPGDHFIMGADRCGETVGHIGVVIEPNVGIGFSCVDANFLAPGQIRGPKTGCVFSNSQISGCLRKM